MAFAFVPQSFIQVGIATMAQSITFTPGYIVSGSNNYGPIFGPLTVPTCGGFTQVNVTTCTGGPPLALSQVGNSGYNWQLMLTSAPTAPYTITVMGSMNSTFDTNSQILCGLILRNSSSGNFINWGGGANNQQMGAFTWTNVTTNAGSVFSQANEKQWEYVPLFWRIHDDGTNRTYSMSVDGVNFATYGTTTNTSYIAANQVGFGMTADAASPLNASWTVYSFTSTQP
jgi:hypothetical protein